MALATPAQGQRTPTQAEVRHHLRVALRTDADLQAFCMVHFPQVAERFTAGMERLQKVNLLFEVADLDEIFAQLAQQGPLARAPLRPEPAYRSPKSRMLSEALQNLYSQRRELLIAGRDPRVLDAQILAKRRELRDGPQLAPGEHVCMGRYLLIEPLGSGGFARVWKAFDEHEGRLVAIKILHGHLTDERSRIERFQRGARQMLKLQHPGIVHIRSEPQEAEGHHFFVMEYLSGGDLRQAVEQRKLASRDALRMVLRIGEALEYAHRQGLLHRDVKPANVLLDGQGDAKLADFDLVWAQDTTGGTAGGAGMGSYNYAAPEAMLDAGEATVRSDVYSLGMSLFFVLYGREVPPRLLGNIEGLLHQVAKPLVAVVKQAIAVEPEQRFPSAVAFCQALRAAVGFLDEPAPKRICPFYYMLRIDSANRREAMVPICLTTFVVGSSGDILRPIPELPPAVCRLLYDDIQKRVTLEVLANQRVFLQADPSQPATLIEDRVLLGNDDVFLIGEHRFGILAPDKLFPPAPPPLPPPPIDLKSLPESGCSILAIADDEGRLTTVPIIRDEIMLGRADVNQIRLTERNISRRHCRLTRKATGLYLEDLNSYLGTIVNGERIQEVIALETGDDIRIGEYRLTVRVFTRKVMPGPAPALTAATDIPVPEAHITPARLIAVSLNFARMEYSLDRVAMVIGRTDDNDIVLNHRSISRHHAKIIREGALFHIVDMQSANGVRVNGEEFGKVALRRGDSIDLGHVRLIFVPPGQHIDVSDKIVDLDLPARSSWRWVGGALVVAALAYGGYRWQTSPPTPPLPLDIAQTVAAFEQDVRAENWSEAKRKVQRILADPKIPAMIKEAVRQKQGNTEQNEQAQAAFERFKVAAKSADPDEAVNLHSQIPAASVYFARAAETYSQLLLRFRDVHLQRAQAACQAGMPLQSQREVDKVLSLLPKQIDALRLSGQDCVAAKPAELLPTR